MFGHPGLRVTLPHAHPIVLVDRVLDLQPGVSIETAKAISSSEPCYAATPTGQASGYPALLLLESFVQSAALLWLDHRAPQAGEQLLFAGVSSATFHLVVHPGDVVIHRIELKQLIGSNAFFGGYTHCGQRSVLKVGSVVLARRLLTEDAAALQVQLDPLSNRNPL